MLDFLKRVPWGIVFKDRSIDREKLETREKKRKKEEKGQLIINVEIELVNRFP